MKENIKMLTQMDSCKETRKNKKYSQTFVKNTIKPCLSKEPNKSVSEHKFYKLNAPAFYIILVSKQPNYNQVHKMCGGRV